MIRPWRSQRKWVVLDGMSFFTALVWSAGALPSTFVTGRTPVALPLNECHEKSGASANVLPSAADASACAGSGVAIIAVASPHARPQRGTGAAEAGASSGTLPDAAKATELSQIQSDNVLSAIVVEAEPCTFTDIPKDAVEAIHGLLAGSSQNSERLAVVPLDKLRPSPFYNMLADGEPVEKALTLLHFTQRSNGKQHGHGFRIVTERVQDATTAAATELTKENCYATVALCTFEKSLDFTAAKDAIAMAVISKVVTPSKPLQHTADLYIEAMELISKNDVPDSMEMMRQMQLISDAQSANSATSSGVTWRQRKCRRLLRYPTST